MDSSVGVISHYDVLGVPVTATVAEIREAYRREARRHHPDQVPSGSTATQARMSAINEAYRVLRDPGRRSLYDAQLGGRHGSAVPTTPRPTASWSTASRHEVPVVVPVTPARYPWKLVLAMAAIGITVVLVGAALYRPSDPPPPDNVLEPGSCVEIEYTGDAREVNCDGVDDLVVRVVVPFDTLCPVGTSAHRDRQGLGNACVEPPADLSSG